VKATELMRSNLQSCETMPEGATVSCDAPGTEALIASRHVRILKFQELFRIAAREFFFFFRR
jgi:hypothetical protein